jgi:DNA-binding PadR family transcriptional regulator
MNISSYLPLTESTFFIMLSLSAGPRHGYAILKEVQELSDNRILLSTGTLYGAIKRLLDQSWIVRFDGEPEEEADGRGKKVYQLTDLGRRILQAEVERLETLTRKARLHRLEDGI